MVDNASSSCAQVVTMHLQLVGVSQMELPAMLTNLNPTRHLWVHLKCYVNAHDPPPHDLKEV